MIKTLQIASAQPGWVGVFKSDSGEFALPVACWVLLEDDGDTYVDGVCADVDGMFTPAHLEEDWDRWELRSVADHSEQGG